MPTLALAHHIQAMVPISGHKHIGLPVPTLLAHGGRCGPPFEACLVLDPLAGLPIRAFGSPLAMVTRKRGNQVLRTTRDVLINGQV